MYASSTESMAFLGAGTDDYFVTYFHIFIWFFRRDTFQCHFRHAASSFGWHPAQAVWLCMVTIIKVSATCVTIPSCSIVFFAII